MPLTYQCMHIPWCHGICMARPPLHSESRVLTIQSAQANLPEPCGMRFLGLHCCKKNGITWTLLVDMEGGQNDTG